MRVAKKLSGSLLAAALAVTALPCAAVPDADGKVTSTPAPDLSQDNAMKARLNYNLGYELFEKALQLENNAAASAAKARAADPEVKKGLAEAREHFRTVVAADPNMKEGWNLLGYTSRRLGDYEESLSAYDAALKLQPDYPEAIEYRAELFLLTGRLDQAKQAYAALLKSSPSYAGTLLQSMRGWAASSAAQQAGATDRDAFKTWVATQKL